MAASPLTRRLVVLLAVLLALAVAGVALHRLAVTRMKAAVLSALGPRASVGDLSASWSTIELTELRVRGNRAAGWPADDELRARRVRVVPDLRSLFYGPWRIASVEVEGAQLALLRQRDGSLRVLPALLDRGKAALDARSAPLAGTALVIDRVVVDAGRIELFDASVRRPPHHLQLEALAARIGPLHLPALDAPVAVDMKATLKGPQRDGRITIAGTTTPTTSDSQLDAHAEGVDLVVLQPYLLKSGEAGVRRGTLDLSLAARVKDKQLHAPGEVTLTGLELSSGSGPLATFAGVPRQAVLAAMGRDGHIEIAFTLEGRLDDPSFSINEAFALRTAASLAKSLGVSLEGVVEGVGGVLKGLLGR